MKENLTIKAFRNLELLKIIFYYVICNGPPSPLALGRQTDSLLLTKEEEKKKEVRIYNCAY